ncbi:hypothetical protein HWV62_11898, partial [Athelia sp. TMB]
MPYTLAGGRMSSDDIEILSVTESDMRCQLCHADLAARSPEQRQAHYERHFAGTSASPKTASPNPKTREPHLVPRPQKKVKELWRQPETDTFWYAARTDAPPPNFSPGLIPVLKRALTRAHARGATQRAVLCYDRTVHIAREFWDVGWGCGYRNYLMACTALMDQPAQPLYFALLDDTSPPSVRNLQHLIESAWKHGYDPDGARDLKHKLVGTSKWIGTAELYTAFTYRRIPCALVDFDLKKQDKDKAVKSVINWVVSYFSPPPPANVKASLDDALRGAAPVVGTDRMPLILQHAGHSRTIVGYEVDRKGRVNLLTFDPSRLIPKPLRKAGLARVSTAATAHSAAPQAGASRPRTSSTARVLQHLLHPVHKEKRRVSGDKEPEVIVIDDDDEMVAEPTPQAEPSTPTRSPKKPRPEDAFDALEIVNLFKIDPKTLGKKNEYQILYFPMDAPLSEHERLARKEVFSTKI